MNINYNVTGKNRKALAEAIAKALPSGSTEEMEIKYLGAPTYAYKVGEHIVVDREGALVLPNLPQDEVQELLDKLSAAGYEPEELPFDPDRITVTIKNDLTGDEEERLFAIVESKRSLLTKALETDDLPVEVDKDMIRFPWFTNHNIEGEATAYLQLISAIVKMAKEQKRVTAKDKQEENEKFAMRIFTVRLGLKGEDYKLIRKLLTRNLSGNSSWKYGKPEKDDTRAKDEEKPEGETSSEEAADKDVVTDNTKEVTDNE